MEAEIAHDVSHVKNLASLIKDQRLGIIDSETGWIYLNRIWSNQANRSEFYKAYFNFASPIIRQLQSSFDNIVVVIPEGLSSSFGIMPFGIMLARDCESEFAIWKEWGDELRARPLFFPDSMYLTRPAKFVILSDVVGNGIIVRKISKFLETGSTISTLITAIQLSEKEENLKSNIKIAQDEQGDQIHFHRMLVRVENDFFEPGDGRFPRHSLS